MDGLIVIRMFGMFLFLYLGCVHPTKQRRGVFFQDFVSTQCNAPEI